jgi:NAD(P)-dependent dehydrogenase (short-subunit alcohol dehydrogenase family)
VADDGGSILPGMSLPVATKVGQSAVLSQLAIVPGDEARDDAAFPKGKTDGNSDLGQQLDLRAKNSWMLKLEDVSTPEMAEVLAINALAPAVINGRLKAFMEASGAPELSGADSTAATLPTGHDLKFIVNVSAMEGRFYKFKQPTHPHTNMAKAALNMMTRTSAADYAKSKIYMTAVDTGWINDEKPAAQAAADAATHNFQTPIDEIDAAARVLDPIIAPLRRVEAGEKDVRPPSGVFLKDYAQCEW